MDRLNLGILFDLDTAPAIKKAQTLQDVLSRIQQIADSTQKSLNSMGKGGFGGRTSNTPTSVGSGLSPLAQLSKQYTDMHKEVEKQERKKKADAEKRNKETAQLTKQQHYEAIKQASKDDAEWLKQRELQARKEEQLLKRHEAERRKRRIEERQSLEREAREDARVTSRILRFQTPSKLNMLPVEQQASYRGFVGQLSGKSLSDKTAFMSTLENQHATALTASVDYQRKMQRAMQIGAVGFGVSMGLASYGQSLSDTIDTSLQSAYEYEKKMKDIGFIVGDYFGPKFKDAERFIQDFSQRSVWNLNQVQKALYELKSADLTLGEAKSALPGVYGYSLMTGGKADVSMITKMLAGVYNRYKGTPSGLGRDAGTGIGRVANLLAATASTTMFDPTDLMAAINASGSVAPGMGFDLQSMLAVMGAYKSRGIPSAQVGQHTNIAVRQFKTIQSMMERMKAGSIPQLMANLGMSPDQIATLKQNPTAMSAVKEMLIPNNISYGASAEWKRLEGGGGRGPGSRGGRGIAGQMNTRLKGSFAMGLGLDFYDEKGKAKPMLDSLEMVITAIEKLRAKGGDKAAGIVAQLLFGEYGGRFIEELKNYEKEVTIAGRTITLKGIPAIRALSQEIKDQGDILADYREEMEYSLPGIMDKLTNAQETFRVTFGQSVAAVKAPLMALHTEILNLMSDAIKASPVLGGLLGGGISTGASVAKTAGGIGSSIFGFASALSLTLYYTRELNRSGGFKTLDRDVRGIADAFRVLYNPLVDVSNQFLGGIGIGKFRLTLSGLGAFLKYSFIGTIIGVAAYLTNFGGVADRVNGILKNSKLIWGALMEYRTKGGNTLTTLGALAQTPKDKSGKSALSYYEEILIVVNNVKKAFNGMAEGFATSTRFIKSEGGGLLGLFLGIFGTISRIILKASGLTTTSDVFHDIGVAVGIVAGGLVLIVNKLADGVSWAIKFGNKYLGLEDSAAGFLGFVVKAYIAFKMIYGTALLLQAVMDTISGLKGLINLAGLLPGGKLAVVANVARVGIGAAAVGGVVALPHLVGSISPEGANNALKVSPDYLSKETAVDRATGNRTNLVTGATQSASGTSLTTRYTEAQQKRNAAKSERASITVNVNTTVKSAEEAARVNAGTVNQIQNKGNVQMTAGSYGTPYLAE